MYGGQVGVLILKRKKRWFELSKGKELY